MEILNTYILARALPPETIGFFIFLFGFCLAMIIPFVWLVTYKPKYPPNPRRFPPFW